ncbi:MAG: efflux RND transporter periplasmic adaptor subunit [Gammaproteobacteria bacterium]|nr:efflux RND transporter periplasmic adaptor subunit [Gammaproteobacteria bacterium]
MSNTKQSRWHVLWVLLPVAIGILVLFSMARGKKAPQRTQQREPARAVRVIEVPRLDFIPQAEGHGTVLPAQVWTAAAQVSGRIMEMHPRLRNGEFIPADTLLFRIDPTDYQLSLAQAKAELAELSVRAENTRASLAIEKRNLVLVKKEQARQAKLAKRGTLSQSSADAAARITLNARAAVQNLRNTLALIPFQRELIEVKVAQAERNLSHTRVNAPFNLRVADLQIEAHQYVSKGQRLFAGDSVDRVEVIAQVPMSSLRNLFIGRPDRIKNIAQMNEQLADITDFKPVIQMDLGAVMAEWPARFVRFSDNVDTQTHTAGVVVAVDKPLSYAKPGERPPLSKGMFVRVVLRGHPQPERLLLPRAAIRGNKVYVADAEQRLRTRVVTVLFSQGNISVIEAGIEAGEQVVASDLVPAVDGMLLLPRIDETLQQQLIRSAGDPA